MYSSNQVVKCGLFLPLFLKKRFNIFLTLWKVTDLIAPPDLNQARVNKCLIALVNRKIVLKENSTVCIIFAVLKVLYLRLYLMFLRGLSCITGKAYLDVFFLEHSLLVSRSSLPM